jgi:TRAP-type mannitol/chloroaromatic compound transport system permease small subunit
MELWERSQSALNPPIWPVKLMIPVRAVLILLLGIVKLARDICDVLDSPLANELEVEGTSGVHH